MSLADVQKEVEHWSTEELNALKAYLDRRLALVSHHGEAQRQILGSLAGTIEFGVSWEDPLPASEWEAEH